MPALKSSPAHKNTGIEARCAATGMRMTEQRRVIARVLANSVDHPDVEELYRRCVAVDDKISISTVYRTVKLFEDAGIIERHDFREGRARYEQMPDSHHDHLINLRDGTVIEFTSEEIEKLQAEIAKQQRFLDDPNLFQKDRKRFDQASDALTKAQKELAEAEDKWLELEVLREEIEQA